MTIAGETFMVTQTGVTPLSLHDIFPSSGPVTGRSLVTIEGKGFQVGASVSIGGVIATVYTLTRDQIVAITGMASTSGDCDVVVTNPDGQSAVLHDGFLYVGGPFLQGPYIFVPIVLSAAGLKGSYFTSEMTLTNRSNQVAFVDFECIDSLGSGYLLGGTDKLAAGRQKIVPDMISYLMSLEPPIPSPGNQGGTLKVSFGGLDPPTDRSVSVRTTTVVPEGRAGLAYAGIQSAMGLTGPSYLCGLRQNQTDRSNVAIQNVGDYWNSKIILRLTVFSGDEDDPTPHVLPDQILAPGEWAQISGILISNGLSLRNGYVRVEPIGGTAPYYAYGVINDQVTSDGSFIPPIPESAMTGKTRMTLPVVVETSAFSTELVVTNWSKEKKTLNCRYVADAIQTADNAAKFTIEVDAGQQLIWPDLVQRLRDSQVTGIGPKGPTYAGALFVSVEEGDLSGISVAARTSTAGGGGEYGLFYTALPEGTASTSEAWLYGLQQNEQNRTNLALVNTGETDTSADTFRIEIFNGDTGLMVAKVDQFQLAANRWYQFGMILSRYAPGVSQGYARITRTAGNNPFITYGVINDGGAPGQRSGDGAFISSAP
jgi:hypothetical protein